jgi:hypothetical protein
MNRTQVAGPEVYLTVDKITELWRRKISLSSGRPFDVGRDISIALFESMKRVTIGGSGQNMLDAYLDLMRCWVPESNGCNGTPSGGSMAEGDSPFAFPEAELSEEHSMFDKFHHAVARAIMTPFPKLYLRLYTLTPSMRRACALKQSIFDKNVSLSLKKMAGSGAAPTSALDYMVRREILLARKATRSTEFNFPQIRDELYGYITGGVETTASALKWAMKYLTKYPDIQQKLRESIRTRLSGAASGARQPLLEEIIKAQVCT